MTERTDQNIFEQSEKNILVSLLCQSKSAIIHVVNSFKKKVLTFFIVIFCLCCQKFQLFIATNYKLLNISFFAVIIYWKKSQLNHCKELQILIINFRCHCSSKKFQLIIATNFNFLIINFCAVITCWKNLNLSLLRISNFWLSLFAVIVWRKNPDLSL